MDLSSTIKDRALTAGFDLAGIVSLDAVPQNFWDDLDFARRWVDKGRGGKMHYLANPKRDDPRRVLPSLKSVICVGLVYNAPLPYSTEVTESSQQQQSAVGSWQKGVGSRQKPEGSQQKAVGSKQEAVGSSQKAESSRGDAFYRLRTARRFLPSADCPPPTDFRSHAWISRYAWGHDYHSVMRSKLERLRTELESLAPGVETRVYVDTGPVVERALARYSGIGWVGKNTCLINQEKGSWFFLGVILTNIALTPDFPAPDRCGSCTQCLEACPTGALTGPYVMDASRCISYFTIELTGSIPLEFRSAVGRNVFGCDICQDVCPWNSSQSSEGVKECLSPEGARESSPGRQPWDQMPPQTTKTNKNCNLPALSKGSLPGLHYRAPSGLGSQPRQVAITDRMEFQPMQVALPEATEATRFESQAADGRSLPTPTFSLYNPPLEALASLSEEDFRQVFSRSPIKRAKYRGWLRNLCVAMGNSGSAQFVPWLERACRHPDPVVLEHAEWALARLQGTGDREQGKPEIRK